jgi:lysophospholipase L1-like esterase
VSEDRRVARLRECGIDPASTERGLAQKRWLETAKAAGVAALDATPILAAAPDPAALFLSDGGHLSVAGHEAVAAWLAQELARLWR